MKENFVYTTRATIENLAPAQGEQSEYKAAFDERTGSLIEDYALITVTPGVTGQRTVMVLAGIYSEGTEAAADFVTNASYLDELNQRLRQLRGQSAPPEVLSGASQSQSRKCLPDKSLAAHRSRTAIGAVISRKSEIFCAVQRQAQPTTR